MSKLSFHDLAKDIVRLVGGAGNIASVANCATRLRFRLKDGKAPQRDELNKREGILSLVEANGQFQIVIGPRVPELYEIISSLLPSVEGQSDAADKTETQVKMHQKILAFIQSIVSPIVPALAGAGMLKALLLVLGANGLGWLDPTTPTFKILMAASNSSFYFLPLLFAYSTALQLKVPPVTALIIVGALMEPNFTGLMKAPGDVVQFFGMPVVMMNYASTIVPAVITVLLFSWLHRKLEKLVPANVALFVLPMLSLLIMVPLAAIVIGPIGVSLAAGLTKLFTYLSGASGMILGAVLGAGWVYLVVLGVHLSTIPIMLNNIASMGFDTIKPIIGCANFAQGGAAFGVFLRAKQKKTKAYALSTLMPMLLGGITEPIVYGISIRFKKPMVAATIGGSIGGAYVGAMSAKCYAYIFASLITLPAFFGETFIHFIIGISMSFFITAALTYIAGIDEGPEKA